MIVGSLSAVFQPAPGQGGGRGESGRDGGKSALGARRGVDGRPLSAGEERQLRELQARDREVRAHEAAHQAMGGTGGATFSYQTGPDGRQYAIGGEVQIDVGRESDPRATVAKMQRVIAAALAPADPSPQDRAVAAQARAAMAEAQREIAESERAEAFGEPRSAEGPAPAGPQQARLDPGSGAGYGYGSAGGTPAGGLLDLIA